MFSGIDRAALRRGLPVLIPGLPFGIVIGVAAMDSAMPAVGGWLTSVVIFAGASQLTTVTLAGTTSAWAVVLAALVINSRHLMYSAAMSTAFSPQPRWFRVVGPFLLIDQIFAMMDARTDLEPGQFRRHYLTLAVFFYVMWIAMVSVGMLLGPVIPGAWRIDMAPAIMFTGLLLIAMERSPAAAAAIVGGSVAFVGRDLPDRLGILAGAVAGVIAGGMAEWVAVRRGPT